MDGGTIDAAVDDQMCDMQALWPELACQGLGNSAQPGLGRGKSGKPGAATYTCGGASEQDGPFSAREHVARRFPTGHEPGETGELPDLLEQFPGCFQRRPVGVGAGVEQADFHRSDVALDRFEQRGHALFVPRVAGEGVGFPAGRFDASDMGRGFFHRPPHQTYNVAAFGKAPPDRRADGVARAYDNRNFVHVASCCEGR